MSFLSSGGFFCLGERVFDGGELGGPFSVPPWQISLDIPKWTAFFRHRVDGDFAEVHVGGVNVLLNSEASDSQTARQHWAELIASRRYNARSDWLDQMWGRYILMHERIFGQLLRINQLRHGIFGAR